MDHKPNETDYVEMPEEYSRRKLNALYREVPLKDTASRLLRKYFNAMANLYGIIPLHKAKEILFSLSPSLVTEKEFLAFAEIARHECEDYYILGDDELYTDGKPTTLLNREIIDVSLIKDNLDLYIETKINQQGKPYYIPTRKQLLEYDDPFYCEKTPEKTALCRFLKERFHLGETEESAVFLELLYGVRSVSVSVNDVFNRLNDMGLSFEKDSDIQAFASLYQKFHNTTRMPCNRGYTPDELMAMRPPENRVPQSITLGPNIRKAIADGDVDADELRKQILTMEMPNEGLRFSLLKELAEIKPVSAPEKKKKVGRNDPGPCGSGKKYKRCCGK